MRVLTGVFSNTGCGLSQSIVYRGAHDSFTIKVHVDSVSVSPLDELHSTCPFNILAKDWCDYVVMWI